MSQPNKSFPVVYVDARCLQDESYKYRGVGFHVASLLRARSRSNARNWRTIALVDSALPDLPAEYRTLFSAVSLCWNPPIGLDGAVFVSASPMTHDPALSARFISHSRLVRAAVIYDFIPLDRPGYLPLPSHRIDYCAQIARLKYFDLYFPISEYSAKRLREVTGATSESICVTGASVRAPLYEEAARRATRPTPPPASRSYVFTLGGGDRRKNTELVVRAVRRLRENGKDIGLKIVGHYGADYRQDVFAAAGESGAEYVEILSDVSDAALVDLYAGAVATVAPSHIEGFSLPVVEAVVCGSPVIASSCAAQVELVRHRAALFESDDDAGLAERLDRVLSDASLRREIYESQAVLAKTFHEHQVGQRFWKGICSRVEEDTTGFSIGRRVKPRVAFVSPYPPEASGVARFTELTIEAAAKKMEVHLFTNADRPITGVRPHFHDAGPVHYSLLRRSQYDSVISVIGNSHYHLPMFEVMERFGGPCILHDSRLTHIYRYRMGAEKFRLMAERLLSRPVNESEVAEWLQDQNVPSLFVEPILEKASPLIVHTCAYQKLLRERYSFEAQVTTFPPNMHFSAEELTEQRRCEARERLEIPDDVYAIVSLGFVSATKGTAALFAALGLLRRWKIPARLYMAGSLIYEPQARQIAESLGVAGHVRFHDSFVTPQEYRDYIIAADVGVQLRTYGYGQPSAGLMDCISGGLPCVAPEELAASCDAPPFVFRIRDAFSPLHVAEGIAQQYDSGTSRKDTFCDRHEFLRTHTFATYTDRLMSILGLT